MESKNRPLGKPDRVKITIAVDIDSERKPYPLMIRKPKEFRGSDDIAELMQDIMALSDGIRYLARVGAKMTDNSLSEFEVLAIGHIIDKS